MSFPPIIRADEGDGYLIHRFANVRDLHAMELLSDFEVVELARYTNWYGLVGADEGLETVSYTHLTLPTNREV